MRSGTGFRGKATTRLPAASERRPEKVKPMVAEDFNFFRRLGGISVWGESSKRRSGGRNPPAPPRPPYVITFHYI